MAPLGARGSSGQGCQQPSPSPGKVCVKVMVPSPSRAGARAGIQAGKDHAGIPGHHARLALHGEEVQAGEKGRCGQVGPSWIALPQPAQHHRAPSTGLLADLASPRGLTGSLERKEQILRDMGNCWLGQAFGPCPGRVGAASLGAGQSCSHSHSHPINLLRARMGALLSPHSWCGHWAGGHWGQPPWLHYCTQRRRGATG